MTTQTETRSARDVSVEEMTRRVARFASLKPTPTPFVDSQIEGALREIYLVIGKGVVEHEALRSAIPDAEDFNVTIVKAPPGNGASLHAHATSEVFVPLTGKWSIFWTNEKGQDEIVIEPFDVFSCPVGVMRGFRNESNEDAWLLAITGGDDSGRVYWHPEVIEKAAAHGWYLDSHGNVRQAPPGQQAPSSGSALAQQASSIAQDWYRTEMIATRLARFVDLVPSDRPFVDTVIPGHERQNFNVIGKGVTEDAGLEASIIDAQDFNVTFMRSSPAKGPALHDHKTVEVFISLTGHWEVIWGENGEHRLELHPFDMISIPAGVMRAIRNIGHDDQWLMTILGTSTPGRVSWHPDVLAQARARGLGLDGTGNLVAVR
jgi:uncharacterized RmlC-like cupin family protein